MPISPPSRLVLTLALISASACAPDRAPAAKHVRAAKTHAKARTASVVQAGKVTPASSPVATPQAEPAAPHHVNPNNPDEDAHHHAFLVEKDEFDRAMEILKVRGIRLVKYSDENHNSFPGRHAYFHDPDGNCIEICYLYKDGET